MLQNENDLALGYASDPAHLFLGLLSMVAMLRAHPSTAHAPMTVVLPPPRSYPYTPRFYDFAMSWEADASGGRNLKFQPVLMKEFLKAETGISVLFLVLRARDRKQRDHVNMLLFHPLSMTIERFSGSNNVAHVFDTAALDSRLGRLFSARNSAISYMALANGGVGLQTLLDNQRVGVRLGSFEGAILLLYMQTRVMHTIEAKGKLSPPLVFQRALLNSLLGPLRDKGALLKFVQGYARLLTVMRPLIVDQNGYDRSLPFWSNVVLLLKSLLSETPREPYKRGVRPLVPEPTWLQTAQNQISKMASGVRKLANRVSNTQEAVTVDQVITEARKQKEQTEKKSKSSNSERQQSALEPRATRMVAEPGDAIPISRESDDLAGAFAKMGINQKKESESSVNPVWKWLQNVKNSKRDSQKL
jgi:hypothetical protein